MHSIKNQDYIVDLKKLQNYCFIFTSQENILYIVFLDQFQDKKVLTRTSFSSVPTV